MTGQWHSEQVSERGLIKCLASRVSPCDTSMLIPITANSEMDMDVEAGDFQNGLLSLCIEVSTGSPGIAALDPASRAIKSQMGHHDDQ